jgi:hypothetical protein
MNSFCWLSGYTASSAPDGWWAPWYIHRAHLASGQGRAVRVDDPRAVLPLCPLAHMLHVSDSDRHPEMVVNGVAYPTIDERHTMFLKINMDDDGLDEDFLRTIWIGELPEPEPPPEFWLRELYRHQGILL